MRDAAERWAEHGRADPLRGRDHLGPRWEADIREHLARHAYDFVIGSVHDLSRLAVRPPTRRRLGRGPVACRDRRALVRRGRGRRPVRAVRRDRPHRLRQALPLPARHAGRPSRPPRSCTSRSCAPWSRAGTALEVNTSGLRYPAEEAFPSRRSSPASATRRAGSDRRLGCALASSSSLGPGGRLRRRAADEPASDGRCALPSAVGDARLRARTGDAPARRLTSPAGRSL